MVNLIIVKSEIVPSSVKTIGEINTVQHMVMLSVQNVLLILVWVCGLVPILLKYLWILCYIMIPILLVLSLGKMLSKMLTSKMSSIIVISTMMVSSL